MVFPYDVRRTLARAEGPQEQAPHSRDGQCTAAAVTPPRRLERPAGLVDAMRAAAKPGVAIAVVRGDSVVYLDAEGRVEYSEIAAAVSAEDTLFMTASITKTVVAAVVMFCVEQAELDLDEDVNAYAKQVPGWREHDAICNPHVKEAPVTLRMLLTHCSRLNDEEESLRSDEYRTIGSNCAVTLQTYVRRRICEDCDGIWSEDQPPGKADYHYSNAGFTLVGFVVEQQQVSLLRIKLVLFVKRNRPAALG